MKVRVTYTVHLNELERRGIAQRTGGDRLCTREEAQSFLQQCGTDALLDMEADAQAYEQNEQRKQTK